MKSRRRLSVAVSSLLIAGAIGSAYLMGRARASGIPTMQPLTYSGVLTDTTGTPLTGSKNIQVQIWDAATAGNIVCATPSAAQTLIAGNFSVVLPDACLTGVHNTANLWTEVLVDGGSVGRAKIGAVPYAVEADTASNAAGALATKLATIPTIRVNSAGYVTCQPLANFSTAGWNNLLVRAAIYSDSACANAVNGVSCHDWCAGAQVRDPAGFAANCCGVANYYTLGVVDVLQYR
jgi:hypothetical protein